MHRLVRHAVVADDVEQRLLGGDRRRLEGLRRLRVVVLDLRPQLVVGLAAEEVGELLGPAHHFLFVFRLRGRDRHAGGR